MLLKKVAIGIPLKTMDSIGSKDGVEFDTAGYLDRPKYKRGTLQGASPSSPDPVTSSRPLRRDVRAFRCRDAC